MKKKGKKEKCMRVSTMDHELQGFQSHVHANGV